MAVNSCVVGKGGHDSTTTVEKGVKELVYWLGSLYFGLQPCLEFFKSSEPVGDFVLLDFIHLSVSVGVRSGDLGGWIVKFWEREMEDRGRSEGRTSCLRTRILDPILLRVSS